MLEVIGSKVYNCPKMHRLNWSKNFWVIFHFVTESGEWVGLDCNSRSYEVSEDASRCGDWEEWMPAVRKIYKQVILKMPDGCLIISNELHEIGKNVYARNDFVQWHGEEIIIETKADD